jgi:ABC-type dipeptide/oligopeptide/nickel transport system ATPase component
MQVRQNLLAIFNTYRVVPNQSSLEIAKHFKFKWSKSDNMWIAEVREIRGEKISSMFQKFLKQYNKHYRVDVAAKEFYQLSDDDIDSMFDELPYFVTAYHGREKFKPNAASFLKEKIWLQDYPNKPHRDRSKKISINEAESWSQYLGSMPMSQRSTYEAYKELMSFEEFKKLVAGA